MKLRQWLVFVVGISSFASVSAAQPQAPGIVVQMRPTINVLLEDLHNQSRAGAGQVGAANFGQNKLKDTLEQSGAEVGCTLDLLATVPPAERKLTANLLSRFDVVISNGRYRGNSWPVVEFFTDDEAKALDDYMQHGGIFFVSCAGATLGNGIEPPLYNPLLKAYGVQVAFDDFKGSREVTAVKSLNHPLMKNLPALLPLFPTTLVVTNHEAKTLYKLDGRPMMVLIPRGKGALIVAGGGSGWMNQGIETSNATLSEPNKKFLQNLMDWVAQKDAMGLAK